MAKKIFPDSSILDIRNFPKDDLPMITQNISDAIFITSGGDLKYLNERGFGLFGYSGDDAPKSFFELIHPDDREKALTYHQKSLSSDIDKPPIEYRIINKSGEVRWISVRSRYIQWEDKPARIMFANDITKQKQIEQDLENYKSRLSELTGGDSAEFQKLYDDLQRELEKRKEIEESLKKSEEMYRMVVETTGQSIAIGQDGYLKYANPKLVEIAGHSEEYLKSRPFTEFIHPDDVERVVERYLLGLQGIEKPGTYMRYRIIDGKGNTRWVVENGDVIEWEGRPATLVFHTDITDWVEMYEAQRESERKYKDLFETAGDGVFLATLDGKIIDINPAGEVLAGYSKEELKEFNSVENILLEPLLASGFQEKMTKHGFVKDLELTLKRKDGALVDCLMTATVTRDQNKKITGYQGIIKDITERKRFVDITFDSIADGVYSVDSHYTITMFNASAEAITGISREKAMGKKCYDIFKSSICEKRCALKQAIETGKPVIDSMVTLNRNGSVIPVSVSTTVLKDRDDHIIGGVTTFRDMSIIEELRKEIKEEYTFQDIVSKNSAMQEIFKILPDISESNSPVLLGGKSGTGKEMFAKAIHNLSTRKDGPFVAINCAALPENLLESELFGHVKGAFTSAHKDKAGRFSLADGGTIFFDEVVELTPKLQAKLLRVLEEKKFEPLGSEETIEVDVRIIASSNKDISQEIIDNHFREDLFYRLSIIKIDLPDLKDRREDIPLLVEYFMKKISVEKGKKINEMSRDVLNVLMNYNYPGNVRELQNIIEHAIVICQSEVITMEHLPKDLIKKLEAIESEKPVIDRYDAEKYLIEDALKKYRGNRTHVARALKMGRTTLWRKMKEYSLL